MPNSARSLALSSPRARRALTRFCLAPLAATAAFALSCESSLAARENLIVARPFEVGASLSGNYLAAIIAGAERDTLAASTFFREALRDDPKNTDLADRAFVAALANGNLSEAITLSRNVLAHDRANGLAHLARGVDAVKNRKYPAARAEFAKGGGDRRRDITSTLLTAWSYAGAKDTRRALATLDTLNDEAFVVFRDYHAALIADLGGDKAEAEKRFKSAYSAERNTLRLVDAYARFLATRGQRDEARQMYKSFDDVAPNHPIVVAGLAALDEGKPLSPFVRSADDGAGEVLYGLGAVGGRQGDELASLIYLRLSLYLAPQNALAIVTLGDVYERMKQEEAAIDLYDSVPDDSPLRVNADVQAALLLETLGKSKEASEHLAAVVAANPKNQEALTALGNLQRSRKLFADAATTYTRVLDLQPKTDRGQWLLYYYRGIANERSKNWPAAEADLKKALELNPDQPLVLELSRLFMGRSGDQSRRGLQDAAPRRRSAAARRLCRRQSWLGLLPARAL